MKFDDVCNNCSLAGATVADIESLKSRMSYATRRLDGRLAELARNGIDGRLDRSAPLVDGHESKEEKPVSKKQTDGSGIQIVHYVPPKPRERTIEERLALVVRRINHAKQVWDEALAKIDATVHNHEDREEHLLCPACRQTWETLNSTKLYEDNSPLAKLKQDVAVALEELTEIRRQQIAALSEAELAEPQRQQAAPEAAAEPEKAE